MKLPDALMRSGSPKEGASIFVIGGVMKITNGYYTTDNSDLYMHVIVKYQNPTYIKANISLFYKYGEYKGVRVEKKNYKIEKKNITHWKPYIKE